MTTTHAPSSTDREDLVCREGMTVGCFGEDFVHRGWLLLGIEFSRANQVLAKRH